MVIFITGKAGAGKTTVANKLKKRLEKRGRKVLILDGDDVRNQREDCGFSELQRYTHVETMADFAAIAERQGLVVIVSAIMPRENMRMNGRSRVKKSCLVYVRGGTMWTGSYYFPPSKAEKEGLYYEIQSYDRPFPAFSRGA